MSAAADPLAHDQPVWRGVMTLVKGGRRDASPREVALHIRSAPPDPAAPQPHWLIKVEGIVQSRVAIMGGAVVLYEEADYREGVRVMYDPPIELLPAAIDPATASATATSGAAHQQTVRVRVADLNTGALRHRGTCVITRKLVAVRQVATPAGDFQAYVFQKVRKMDLGVADATIVLDTAYAPGMGVVAEHIDRTTRMLKLLPVRQVETYRLLRRQ